MSKSRPRSASPPQRCEVVEPIVGGWLANRQLASNRLRGSLGCLGFDGTTLPTSGTPVGTNPHIPIAIASGSPTMRPGRPRSPFQRTRNSWIGRSIGSKSSLGREVAAVRHATRYPCCERRKCSANWRAIPVYTSLVSSFCLRPQPRLEPWGDGACDLIRGPLSCLLAGAKTYNSGMIWNPRGSIWHRWDPHIHAPGTLLSDQFNGDWDGYLTAIEKSDPIIRALGVTDYLCLGTYKEVRRRKQQDKRLPNVFCIFPNVEFRLDTKTAKARAINIHLLFSPDDPNHEYEIECILRKLKFEFQDRSYACSRSELIALGRAFDKNQTDEEGALRIGANQFKVTLANLLAVFKEDRKWLSKNCLVAVAGGMNDGTAGLKEDDSFAAFRREVESFAHIIFAATPQQREFWLGRTPAADKDAIEATYKALKPCMHGCDAHRVEMVGKTDLDRYCWLKGDLSFETLRQAVIEPANRVWIGDTPPVGPSPSETLRHIVATGAPWIATPSLKLNSGLITIIGARGSGKTALMEFLAAGANAFTATPSESSFIQRAGDLLQGTKVTLGWADNKENTVTLHASYGLLEDDTQSPEVCYLSQQFVERLCSSSGLATELKEEMERVVFEATPSEDRMQCESFRELAGLSLMPTRANREELQNSIMSIGDAVLKEEILRDQLPTLNNAIQTTKNQIDGFQKELKELLPKDKEAHTKRLQELEGLCAKAEAALQSLRARQKHINDLAADVKQTVESREPSRFQDLRARLLGLA